MTTEVKPSPAVLREALELSEGTLRAIELAQTPLTNVALMTSRLARLLNDFDYQKIFEYEAGGYPSSPNGVSLEVWRLAQLAGRVYEKKEKEEVKHYATVESIEQLESQLEGSKLGLEAAKDAGVSVSSANPHQYVNASGNGMERYRLHNELRELSKKLSARRSFVYSYVLRKNLELRFSGIAGDAFARIRNSVDNLIGATVPDAAQKFTAIYENLQSDNPEDWSNAVHSCRRVLQDLADHLFPANDTPRTKRINNKEVKINLGADRYINRLICFAEDNSGSERSVEIVGSQLEYLGDRLDALFKAAQKGSHATISTRAEADRYVVYTYMIVGDLLQLKGASAL